MSYVKEDCEVFPIIVPVEYGLKTINFFLVRKEKRLLLIDAGIDDELCWGALNKTLNENGFSIRDITEIILTHHHFDHIGLVNRIVQEHPIPVYASPLSIKRLKRDSVFMKNRLAFYERFYQEMGCGELGKKQIQYLNKALEKNKHQALQCEISPITVSTFQHFSVLEIPGHAPDHLAFWDKERNWLFSGDLLLEHISSNALIEPDENGNRLQTLIQQRDSLLKCLKLQPEIVFSGHGQVISEPNRLIQLRLERIEDKAERFYQLILTGFSTASEIAETYYKKTYLAQFSLVMSEVVSHLDYLELQGKIKKKQVKGIWHYSAMATHTAH